MTESRRGSAGRPSLSQNAYRLDLTVNPFGASPRVYDALASRDDLHIPSPERTSELRTRIGALHKLPPSWVALAGGIDRLLLAAVSLAGDEVLVFPPTEEGGSRTANLLRRTVVEVPRSHRFAVELDTTLPDGADHALALVMSPNDPTGTALNVPEAVRLSRSVSLLVIDERHVAYSPRTLIPLTGEFDNVVILRTMETWAGLTSFPLAYAIAPPPLVRRLEAVAPSVSPAPAAVLAGLTTLDDLRAVNASLLRVRDEKSRLFRTLRKLNMVRPYPSWANFLLAGVERGSRTHFTDRLNACGVAIHLPEQPGLERSFRVSAVSAEATTALKSCLIAAAATL